MLRIKTTIVLATRYLFLTRYSWLTAVILVLLVPVSLRTFPALLANLFVFELPTQIYHVSWAALWSAVTVMETLRVTTLNADARFDDYSIAVQRFREACHIDEPGEAEEWYQTRGGWVTFLLGLTASVAVWHLIMDASITSTAADPSSSWVAYVDSSRGETVASVCWKHAWLGLATTLSVIAIIGGVMTVLRERRRRRDADPNDAHRQPAWQRALYAKLNFILGPGYFGEQPSKDPAQPSILYLAPGHVRMMLYTVTFLLWHSAMYLSARGDEPMPTEESSYPALFYALLSLLVLLYILPGAAFYFDRYRIPVPLLMVGVVLVLYTICDTDHYFELNPQPHPPTEYVAPTLERVFDGWNLPIDKDGRRTLVVVDASGGGIQASAWTAQVLTGLHECYGDPLTGSIGLISSVSGGSVGSMYYLAHRTDVDLDRDPHQTLLTPAAIDRIREVSRASALEATAWGLAYPDTMRTIFPPAVSRTVDRGWAIEQVWRQRLIFKTEAGEIDHGDLRLSQLGLAAQQNQLPIPVFNATLMESGQRLLISPVLAPPSGSPDQTAAAMEFMREFPDAQPHISTAARLSATFPYVTPAARSEATAGSRIAGYHVVDGAYVDNEGAVTSVDWINRLLAYYSHEDRAAQRPFDRVLLIRIQAFPKDMEEPATQMVAPASGWRSALIGPINAMMSVRSASQTERGDLEVTLLTKATHADATAMRERYNSEMNSAQAVVDVLQETEQQIASADQSAATNVNLSPADLARQQSEATDKMRLAKEHQVSIAVKMHLPQLEVLQVMFDFHSPDPTILIPLSWKLTASQKRNIDEAWQSLLDGQHPHQPLSVLDRYFHRVPSEFQTIITTTQVPPGPAPSLDRR